MASVTHPSAHKDQKAVFGLFDQRMNLDRAVDELKTRGFRHSDISVLFADIIKGSGTMAHDNATKSPEGAAAGAATGAVFGGALGWLAGIGSLAIPGVGPLVAAGPIMAAIAGAGLGGTVGGVTGGLVGLGIPEYEAKRYEAFVREGGFLISVHVDDAEWRKKAEEIMKNCGAKSISTKSEKEESAEKRGPDVRPTETY